MWGWVTGNAHNTSHFLTFTIFTKSKKFHLYTLDKPQPWRYKGPMNTTSLAHTSHPMTLQDMSLPPEVMLQAACGMEDPVVVLERHFGDEDKARALLANPAFQKQLEAKQAELMAGGVTTKLKAALFAHDLLDELYLRGKSSQTATAAVIDITKTLAKIGDLEPKPTAATTQGSGFSIQIVLPGSNTQTITVAPVQHNIIDVEPEDGVDLSDLDRAF